MSHGTKPILHVLFCVQCDLAIVNLGKKIEALSYRKLASFCRWVNWNTEKLSDLAEITEQVCGRTRNRVHGPEPGRWLNCIEHGPSGWCAKMVYISPLHTLDFAVVLLCAGSVALCCIRAGSLSILYLVAKCHKVLKLQLKIIVAKSCPFFPAKLATGKGIH